MMNPVVVIPARMQAIRMPGKPLVDIHGEPMIVHVWRRALAAAIGPVVVASGDQVVLDAVGKAGGNTVLTRGDHATGTDRVHEAVEAFDPERNFDVVVNLQGDLPMIQPAIIRAAPLPLSDPAVDMATVVAEITDDADRHDLNVVKAVVSLEPNRRIGRALYFSRAAVPAGDGPAYHHIGLYAYRRAVLARFVALPPGVLELREDLEQLRGLEHGLRIEASLVEAMPVSVDTPADLERARRLLDRLH